MSPYKKNIKKNLIAILRYTITFKANSSFKRKKIDK